MTTLFVKVLGPFSRKFRRARAERILAECPEIVGGDVIDIGGSIPFWNNMNAILRPARVQIYNITTNRMNYGVQNTLGNIETNLYDGRNVPLPDKAADVVLCNSVIEHVPVEARAGLAEEIRRLGKRYVVQTPAYAFPFEVHFGMPFIHWVPRSIGRRLAMISPFRLMGGSREFTKVYFEETRLLGRRELQRYFPDGRIVVERFLGMPKSYLVISGGR